MPQTKQQDPKKKPQFSARNSHSRSASIGRNLNKLGGIKSSDDIHSIQRPPLNRSKSSEGVIARRNRSSTKLSALHPLRRAESQQTVSKKVLIELPKEDSDESDNNSDETKQREEIVEEVEQFSDEEKTPHEPTEQKILSYKSPAQFSHALVPPGSSFSDKPAPQPTSLTISQVQDQDPSQTETKLSQITENLKLSEMEASESVENKALEQEGQNHKQNEAQNHNQQQQQQQHPKKESNSKSEIAHYSQNMILSQSTGLVRAFPDQPFQNSLLNLNGQNQQGHDQLQYIHSNDRISAVNPQSYGNIKSSNNSLRQFTVSSQAFNRLASTSQESSSMLSFKADQALGMTPMSKFKESPNDSNPNTANNFNSFIKQSSANIETRTQQKLWLQRESSLLDLSMLNSSNPQIRREFERISREYLNARRFSNPVVDAVKRVSIDNKASANADLLNKIKSKNLDSIQNKLLKLWFVDDVTAQNGNYMNQLYDQQQLQQQQLKHQQEQQQHFQQSQKPFAIIKSSGDSTVFNSSSLRSPVAPTTRAVDRAHHSSENKRIDLSTARLQETEQLQKIS